MNSLNSSSVDAGAGTVIIGVDRERKAKTDTFGVYKAGAGIYWQ